MFRRSVCFAALLVLCWEAVAPAHYHMLLPERASAVAGKPVSFVFQFGHPFEHELFDTVVPDKVIVNTPDREALALTGTLRKIMVKGADQKDVAAYTFSFTPEKRGDYICQAYAAPLWMEHEKKFLQDSVKVVLHVQTQANWDVATSGFEVVPLTRPYGLEPGMVFQGEVVNWDKSKAGTMVEVERYNPTAPKTLPPDEHITRVVRTDANGTFSCTLTDPGWWCITAIDPTGKKARDGKDYPLVRRATLWVYVDPRPQ